MQYSNARLLSSDGSGHLRHPQRSEPQQFRIIAHLPRDQLNVCFGILSCVRRRTAKSSVVFPTSTLVRAIVLKNMLLPITTHNAAIYKQRKKFDIMLLCYFKDCATICYYQTKD